LQLYQTTNGNFITELDWCEQTQEIAIKTNNNQGYNVEVFIINSSGVVQDMVLSGVNGAAGGIDFNFQGDKLLYTFDDSQVENLQYRQLNTNMYLYDITSATAINLSQFKVNGTNDLDPKFSPNDASVIFVNTSNDGVSQKNIYVMSLSDAVERTLTVENGYMPDWK
jgi:Tol biopolymer transport system component